MDAIETLMNEHRLIESACGALTAFADEARRASADDKAELARFVTFIREFADGHHHGKEEDILFAAMIDAGFSRQAGPVAVMLMEHDQGRAYIRALGELAVKQEPWSSEDRQQLAGAARGYEQLLRAHIHKEDVILYPMACQRLPPEALARVDAACAAYDAKHAASDGDRLENLAGELLGRHSSPGRDGPAAHRVGGCC